MADVLEVTDETYEAEVTKSETPVLVDFWAPWCGPCRVVHPVLEEIDSERDDLTIVSLNTDENMSVAANYAITAIPTLIVFVNGAEKDRIIGVLPGPELEKRLAPFAPPAAV